MASRINKDPRDPRRQKVQRLLRQLRQRAQLRQADVAKKLGTPQSFVSKYEAGERRIDVIDVREICVALGVTFVDFAKSLERMLSSDK